MAFGKRCRIVTKTRSCGSSSSKIAAENQRFSNSGSELIPQPPPHQSQPSGSNISTSASTAFHSVLGSMASKTADEAASAAAAGADACGDDAGNQQYGDPWDMDPAAVALRLLRAEDNRKSPTPAHATPPAKAAPSTNEVARQPVYEAAFDLRLEQREPDHGLDRMAQSPVPLIPGLQQQPLAGPLHPVPSSCSSSEVSLVPGRRGGITGQPSLRDACCSGPLPYQGSSGSISVSSSVQLQPAPTPCGSSSSGGGNPSGPIPAIRDPDLASRQASASIDQSHPLPWSPISENAPAALVGAVAVKRSIHAGVKVLPSGKVCVAYVALFINKVTLPFQYAASPPSQFPKRTCASFSQCVCVLGYKHRSTLDYLVVVSGCKCHVRLRTAKLSSANNS
ncbi:hypothetical protein HPB49_013230 [Dermacentor silvarum]|uniref:Uncharacterized protein n=1 Tax=Dermacentor silvarum TaxID=543639 RepID=A0ACB8CL58_DERSI|nr:hypothetical protein HPB49_013230 [Dermacentor silvarum]